MRERGYYWVRHNDDWYIGYYSDVLMLWDVLGFVTCPQDAAFDEIDEKRIERADPVKEDKSDNLINQFAC